MFVFFFPPLFLFCLISLVYFSGCAVATNATVTVGVHMKLSVARLWPDKSLKCIAKGKNIFLMEVTA
jgi:hypothetical protein